MPLAMTRSPPRRLASLGMLLWATSSAMPIDSSSSNEADGPAAHELSLQPVGLGADLDLERWTATCRGQRYGRKACCTMELGTIELLRRDWERCEDITYKEAGRNCHKFHYFNGALPRPRTRCARALRRAREVSHAMPRRSKSA